MYSCLLQRHRTTLVQVKQNLQIEVMIICWALEITYFRMMTDELGALGNDDQWEKNNVLG
jgi:hypothetical protein